MSEREGNSETERKREREVKKHEDVHMSWPCGCADKRDELALRSFWWLVFL